MGKTRVNLYRHPFTDSVRSPSGMAERITEKEARALLKAGAVTQALEGLIWYVCVLVGKFRNKYRHTRKMDSSEQVNEAAVAILETLRKLKESDKSIPVRLLLYLAFPVEQRLLEFYDRDRLVPISSRTQRDRIKKGQKPIEPMRGRRILKRDAERKSSRTALDVLDYCTDDLDRRIVLARYDGGSGPTPFSRVAEIVGVSASTVRRKLRRMEDELDQDNNIQSKRKKPKKRDALSAACRLTKGGRRTVSLAPARPTKSPADELRVNA